MLAAQLVTGSQSGCQRAPSASDRPAASRAADRPPSVEVPALIPASRCGECHGKMEAEWRGSAHARADVSPLYRAMRRAAGDQSCDRCHAPLRSISPTDPTAAEGVTCDVCHTLSRVQVGAEGGTGFVLHPEQSVRYGPLCDTKAHYFHTMGCSPLHRDAAFCAACHDWSRTLEQGGTLVVFPEFREWRDDTSVLAGQSCQSCHMPAEPAEVAVGAGVRAGVRGHGFALRGRLLGQALSGQAQVHLDGRTAHIVVSLTNTGAAHAVPTGLPERRLQIEVQVVDKAGHKRVEERAFGRVLVDAGGREAPFYRAVRVGEDTRIQAGATRSASFELELPDAGQLDLFVRWRPIAQGLAQRIGVAPPPDEPMLSASLLLPLPRTRSDAPIVLVLRP